MAEVSFIETTLRDGHQSLWATRMTTAHMMPVLPLMDQAGFMAIELMGTVHFEACLRYLRENPWERIRLVAEAAPNTPIGALIRSKSLTSFNLVPDSVIELWIKRCAANGIRRLMIFDALHDWNNLFNSVQTAKSEGIEVVVPLVFSLSPVHTDDFYAEKTREMIQKLDPPRVMIKDSIGLLTPERTRTLVPAIMNEIGDRPLEMHSHCTTGLAPLCCLESVRLGVQSVYTCAAPLANGPSHPSTEKTMNNLKRLGYQSGLDPECVRAISEHFNYVARREGKPLGVPVEYDSYQYIHQIPGGMITNLEYMLTERGMAHRLEEVLEEVSIIRREWGYPVMITPFSQLVGTQAVINCLMGERYKTAPTENIRYLLGHYGATPAPVDQNVLDKITSLPEAKPYLHWEQPQPSISELRREIGQPKASEDELLLRLLFAEEHVEATLKAGPIKTDYPRGDKPLLALFKELAQNRDLTHVSVEKEDFRMELRVN